MRPIDTLRTIAVLAALATAPALARAAELDAAPAAAPAPTPDAVPPGALTLETTASVDGMRVVRGGIARRSAALATLDLSLGLDLATLAGWPGVAACVHAIGHRGSSPSEWAGDAQSVDNLDLPDALRLGEAWLEAATGRLSVRAGVYDVNGEFDTGEVPSLFLNGSHGMGIDFAQSGRNGPAVFPNTALGGRVAWSASDALTARAAVTDGVPGDPADPARLDLRWRAGDGSLVTAEADWRPGTSAARPAGRARVVLGAWRFSGRFHDIRDPEGDDPHADHVGNAGCYLLVEGPLVRERGDGGQGLSGWVRTGFAQAEVNVFDRYTGTGLVVTGLLPGRDADALGVAMAVAHAGRGYFDGRIASGLASDWNEIALELTYRAIVTPWLALQPDAQYVMHPGLEPTVEDAITVGARLEVTF